MWLKNIVVGALVASLAFGPFAGRTLAEPDVQLADAGAIQKAILEIDTDGELVGANPHQVLEDALVGLRSVFDLSSCTGCVEKDLFSNIDNAWQILFNRPRNASEIGFHVLNAPDTPMSVFSATAGEWEVVAFQKVATVLEADFSIPTEREPFEAVGLGWLTGHYDRFSRSLMLLSHDGIDALADVMLLTKSSDIGNISTVLVLSAVEADSGPLPPTTGEISVASWACAISGLLWALNTAACVASIGGCVGSGIGCFVIPSTCCGAVLGTMDILANCANLQGGFWNWWSSNGTKIGLLCNLF